MVILFCILYLILNMNVITLNGYTGKVMKGFQWLES
jgi:hypothetical protein